MVNTIQTSLSGLLASTKKLDAASSNIANADTVGKLADAQAQSAETGTPYTPLTVSQTAGPNGGVQSEIVPRSQPFVPSYAPDSPFADGNGLVAAPNVDLAEELVNSKAAEMAYKSNASVLKTANEMQDTLIKALDKNA